MKASGEDIEAFVLAGGKSSRMGRDKGLVLLKARPMISYVLRALGELQLPVKIIANTPGYEKFGFPVYKDVVPEKGPMGGLLTALENTSAQKILLISCDMPLVSAKAIEALLLRADNRTIVTPVAEEKLNPLFSIYPVFLKEKVRASIASEELKMIDFILNNKHTLVYSIAHEMPWTFRNINNPDELNSIEEKWDRLK